MYARDVDNARLQDHHQVVVVGADVEALYPNVVVVFSNERPEIGQLSKDRWKIFQIRDKDLLDATEKYV